MRPATPSKPMTARGRPTEGVRRSPGRALPGALALLLFTCIAYTPVIVHGGFIWDDDSYVTANPLLHDLDGLKRIWIPRQTPQYYPVVFSTFWIEHQLWELEPRGYHIVNVLLHALNALLVWRLWVVLRLPGGRAAGWLAAAVFALHPVHVESVAWITERKNVLSGAFYLLAALACLQFEKEREIERDSRREAWGWYGASLVLFVLALLSKSVACSLPAALILFMLYQRKRLTVSRLLPLVPMFIIGLVLALNTARIERIHVGAEGADFDFNVIDRLLIACNALLFYPWKLLKPWPVMFIYPRWTIDAGSVALWLGVAAVLAIAAGALVAYVRGWRGPALALAFYAGTIFPALGFVNIYPMRFSFVADHFQYLASLGMIALVVGGLAFLAKRSSLLIVGACVVLPALAVLTWRQARTYESAESVFRDTLSKNNEAWMPHNNLGSIILQRSGDLKEAEHHFREALRIKPDHHPARSNLGECLRRQGRLNEAMAEFRTVIEQIRRLIAHTPAREPAFLAFDYFHLGMVHDQLDQLEEAEAHLKRAVELAPRDLAPRQALAQLLVKQKRLDEAAEHLVIAIQLKPGDWTLLRSLAILRERQGRHAEAIATYQQALSTAPTLEDQLQVAPHLIRLLATSPDQTQRNVPEAVAMAEHLAQTTGGNEPGTLDILAFVYAQAGRTDDAVRVGQHAIEAARRLGLTDLARQIEERVNSYRMPGAATQPSSVE